MKNREHRKQKVRVCMYHGDCIGVQLLTHLLVQLQKPQAQDRLIIYCWKNQRQRMSCRVVSCRMLRYSYAGCIIQNHMYYNPNQHVAMHGIVYSHRPKGSLGWLVVDRDAFISRGGSPGSGTHLSLVSLVSRVSRVSCLVSLVSVSDSSCLVRVCSVPSS
jgi:hypothetical protein